MTAQGNSSASTADAVRALVFAAAGRHGSVRAAAFAAGLSPKTAYRATRGRCGAEAERRLRLAVQLAPVEPKRGRGAPPGPARGADIRRLDAVAHRRGWTLGGLAAALAVPVGTLYAWRHYGRIPRWYVGAVAALEAAS